jgi:uncharacterized repeat protein (TIGR03803 family)
MAAATAVVVCFAPESVIAGSFKIIYSFQGDADGAQPVAPLINIGGTLYGATSFGGAECVPNGCGTIFSITPAGVETILHKFQNKGDGYAPYSLVKADNEIIGVSYIPARGTASYIFSVTPEGKFSVLGSAKNPSRAMNRHPLTEVAGTWYGVDLGTSHSICGNNACGYVYAIKP